MGNTFRDGKVHVLSEKCEQCAFTPRRIVDGARVAQIVRDTAHEPGAHFICHEATIAGADAICAGWWDKFSDIDPLLVQAQALGLIDRSTQPERQ